MIEQKAKELNNDLNEVSKELKRLQSIKCRLLKQKTRSDYNELMTQILNEEQLVKEVRAYLSPKKTTVTTMTIEQIKDLTYDEVVKAIKSIQTKKCLSQYSIDTTEYEKALEIEKQLIEHRQNIKPLNENTIHRSKINDLIDHIEKQEQKIDKDYILELLKNL